MEARWRIHAANGPAISEDTAPDSWWVTLIEERKLGAGPPVAALLKTPHTDEMDWSLPAYRRAPLGGMDAAKELTRTYLQRVLRWWAGEGLQPVAVQLSALGGMTWFCSRSKCG
nr:hypothetical protein [Xanthomonas vasicola]